MEEKTVELIPPQGHPFAQDDLEFLIDLRSDDPEIQSEIKQLLAWHAKRRHRDTSFLRGEYLGQFRSFEQ